MNDEAVKKLVSHQQFYISFTGFVPVLKGDFTGNIGNFFAFYIIIYAIKTSGVSCSENNSCQRIIIMQDKYTIRVNNGQHCEYLAKGLDDFERN